jgi:multidrug efflux pump subunit AcrA (membrane-fusion protein)
MTEPSCTPLDVSRADGTKLRRHRAMWPTLLTSPYLLTTLRRLGRFSSCLLLGLATLVSGCGFRAAADEPQPRSAPALPATAPEIAAPVRSTSPTTSKQTPPSKAPIESGSAAIALSDSPSATALPNGTAAASTSPVAATANQPAATIHIEQVVLTLCEAVDVPATSAGQLTRLAVSEGQTVERGQLLAQMDDEEAAALVRRAELEWKLAQLQAESTLPRQLAEKSSDVALAEWQRAKDSVERFSKSISQTELDRLQLLASKAQLEIDHAKLVQAQAVLTAELKQADLERARLVQQRRQIASPISGTVVSWSQQAGEWVEPGQPVVRVIQLDRLRAEGFAAAGDLPLTAVGREVQLVIPSSHDRPLQRTGRLEFISPELDAVTGQVRFWATFDNSDLSLRAGETGQLTIFPRQAPPPTRP